MTTIIKKGTAKKKIEQILAKLQGRKRLDAYKYCGVLKLNEDPLDMQKRVRDEWE